MTDPHAGADALAGYVRRLFAPEDEVLRELRAEMERRAMPAINISADEGKLIQVLLTAVGARRVLEIGTLGGYSAIWMGRALPPDGRVITLEIEPRHAQVAREFARRAGLEEVIEVRTGPAVETLSALVAAGEPFDACFIDADKPSYPTYLKWARRLVRDGGLILADNAFWEGQVLDDPPRDDDTLAIQQFNRRLAGADDLCATIIPVRDGLALAVVRNSSGRPGTSSGSEPRS